MELKSEIILTPPRDSSTVVLLRDAAQGLEVFLVKRHGLSDVLGGAYVFPGGKLDEADCALDRTNLLDQEPEQLHRQLGEADISPAKACGLFVAALREAFEESGVLFAKEADHATTFIATQKLRDGVPFNQMISQLNLRLNTEMITPWSRWVTPKMSSVSSKRFDTRFFVATLPDKQLARHDNFETTDSSWLSPRAALEHYWRREIELAPPQIMSLAHLARYQSAGAVLSEARLKTPPLICPEPHDHNGERVLCYPGDVRHSIAVRALPGPTLLIYRNRRFEPAGGFEAFFE